MATALDMFNVPVDSGATQKQAATWEVAGVSESLSNLNAPVRRTQAQTGLAEIKLL